MGPLYISRSLWDHYMANFFFPTDFMHSRRYMKIHHSLYLPKWNSFFTFFFYFWKKKISWILLSCMNFQNTERIFHSVKENISSSYTTEKKSEECIHEYQISQRIRKYKFYLNFFTNFLHCLFCIFSMYPLWMYFFVKSNHS